MPNRSISLSPFVFSSRPCNVQRLFFYVFDVSLYRLVNVLRIALLRKTKEKNVRFFIFLLFYFLVRGPWPYPRALS